MANLLRVPNEVLLIVVKYLSAKGVAKLQRTHSRFRKAFMVVKNIKDRGCLVRIFCKMVVPLTLWSNPSPCPRNPPLRVMGSIEHLTLSNKGENCDVGLTKNVRALRFSESRPDMYRHITESLRELTIESWPNISQKKFLQMALHRASSLTSLSVEDITEMRETVALKSVMETLHTRTLKSLALTIPTFDLASLPFSLRELNLFGTKIADISDLCALPLLEELDLGCTQITDTSTPGGTAAALARMPSLTSLNLMEDEISEVGPLATKSWRHLCLALTNTKDVSALQNTRIGHLETSTSSGLKNLAATGALGLCLAEVDDIRLEGAKNMHAVFLAAGRVSFADLAKLDGLYSASFSRTQLVDTYLDRLVELRSLDLWEVSFCPTDGCVGAFTTLPLPSGLRHLRCENVREKLKIRTRSITDALETLLIRHCPNLSCKIVLDRLPKLIDLDVRGSPGVAVVKNTD
jgi:hypothetical protein